MYNAVYVTAEAVHREQHLGLQCAVTLQRARTNVAQEPPTTTSSTMTRAWTPMAGTMCAGHVEKPASSAPASSAEPFDTVLSGTLTLKLGWPSATSSSNRTAPEDYLYCYANMGGVFFPKETFAYSNLDLRIAKKVRCRGPGPRARSRFAAFSVFDSVNRNYSAWGFRRQSRTRRVRRRHG